MKPKKKDAKALVFSKRASKKDRADLAYWNQVVAALNEGRVGSAGGAVFAVMGFTNRSSATLIRVYQEWDLTQNKVVKRSLGDTLAMPAYLAEIIVNLHRHYKMCYAVAMALAPMQPIWVGRKEA